MVGAALGRAPRSRSCSSCRPSCAAAARCGRGAGLFVTAVGFVSAWLWLAPPGRWWVVGTTDELSLLIYAILGVLLATLGARVRLTSARASAAEQRLVLAGEDTGIGIFDLDLATRTVYLSPALALLCRVDAARRRRASWTT